MFSFDNCGHKIQKLAIILKWIALIASAMMLIVSAIILCTGEEMALIGLIGGLVTAITGWFSTLLLYGFGVIVEAHEGRGVVVPAPASGETKQYKPAASTATKVPTVETPSVPDWKCSGCGTMNRASLGSCPVCGKDKSGTSSVRTYEPMPISDLTGWKCSHCGTENSKYVSNCVKCGKIKPHN